MIVDYTKNIKLSCMLKGKPGGGKTETALSFPGPILYIQCDPGTATVHKAVKAGKEIVGIRVTNWKQWDKDVRPFFRDRSKLGEVQTIVVDTWSFFSQLVVESLQDASGKVSMQNWGILLNRQKEYLLELVTMTMPEGEHPGCHVVVNCHTKENSDDEGRIVSVGLALQGQFKDHMEAYFDYSLVCEQVNRKQTVDGKVTDIREFVLHASPPPMHTTKGGALPAKTVVPDGGSAFDLLNKTFGV